MTDEQLDALEQKWSREFGGQEVCELIEEVRRLRAAFVLQPPWDGQTPLEVKGPRIREEVLIDMKRRPFVTKFACQQCEKDGLSTCQHDDRVPCQRCVENGYECVDGVNGAQV